MMKNKSYVKYNEWTLFILFICIIIIFYAIKSPFYLIIFIPIFIDFYIHKYRWKIKLIILISFVLFCLFTYNLNSNINILNKWLDTTRFYNLRTYAIQVVENKYTDQNSIEFIKLIMFNEKNYYANVYNNISTLGITYIFVVSGLHISLMLYPINKIFKNNQIGNFISILICLILSYFLKLSISILRILIFYILKFIFKNKFNNIELTIFSGFILIFLFNKIIYSYSFMMSYLCTLLIMYLSKWIKNKFWLYLDINILCFLITIPFILKINKNINIFIFFYNILFSNMIVFLYIWLIIFTYCPFLIFVNQNIINFLLKIIDWCVISAFFISIKRTYNWSNSMYYTLFLSLFIMINSNQNKKII